MSLRDITDSNGNFIFDSILCNSITCPNINGGSGGGGGSGSVGTLQQVLTAGSNAGNLSITNLNNLSCTNLNATTINNSAYPPTNTTPTFQQILTNNNDANNNSIINLSSLKLVNSYDTTIQASNNLSGILQVVNGNGVVGNLYDSVFNQPPSSGGGSSVASKSWINAAQTNILANVPASITFSTIDSAQTYNASNYNIAQSNITFVLNSIPLTYPSYQNTSSSPICVSGSLMVSFSGTENCYLGLSCCYIPATSVSNGTGINGQFNPWNCVLSSVWSLYSGNNPEWIMLPFNAILAPNSYLTFYAMSNNPTAMCNPLPSTFGINNLTINSRLTITQHL